MFNLSRSSVIYKQLLHSIASKIKRRNIVKSRRDTIKIFYNFNTHLFFFTHRRLYLRIQSIFKRQPNIILTSLNYEAEYSINYTVSDFINLIKLQLFSLLHKVNINFLKKKSKIKISLLIINSYN